MKLLHSYPIEIYISEPGYICIKSDGGRFTDEQIVVLSPHQARLVAAEIHALMEEALHTWNDGIGPESEIQEGD